MLLRCQVLGGKSHDDDEDREKKGHNAHTPPAGFGSHARAHTAGKFVQVVGTPSSLALHLELVIRFCPLGRPNIALLWQPGWVVMR